MLFLGLTIPHSQEIFLPTSLAITTIIINHTDINCVDVTMHLKIAIGLGHSYKLTKILLKLTSIFLIDKIEGSKVYNFIRLKTACINLSYQEELYSVKPKAACHVTRHSKFIISKMPKILYLHSSQKFVLLYEKLSIPSRNLFSKYGQM